MGSQRVRHDWATELNWTEITYEWVNLSDKLSHVWLFAIPWTGACQAPLSVEFSRQEYWSGWPFPSPRNLSHPGIKPGSLAPQADSLQSWAIHIGTSNNYFWRQKYYAKIDNENWKQPCKHIPYWYSLLQMSAQFNPSFLSTSCTDNMRLGQYLPKSIPGTQSMW